jgi:hypothetical protein
MRGPPRVCAAGTGAAGNPPPPSASARCCCPLPQSTAQLRPPPFTPNGWGWGSTRIANASHSHHLHACYIAGTPSPHPRPHPPGVVSGHVGPANGGHQARVHAVPVAADHDILAIAAPEGAGRDHACSRCGGGEGRAQSQPDRSMPLGLWLAAGAARERHPPIHPPHPPHPPEMVLPEGGLSWPAAAYSATQASSILNTLSLMEASTTWPPPPAGLTPDSRCLRAGGGVGAEAPGFRALAGLLDGLRWARLPSIASAGSLPHAQLLLSMPLPRPVAEPPPSCTPRLQPPKRAPPAPVEQRHDGPKRGVKARQGVAQGEVGPHGRPVLVPVHVPEAAVRLAHAGVPRLCGLGACLQGARMQGVE